MGEVIGIIFEDMNSAKTNLNLANKDNNNINTKLFAAIASLQVECLTSHLMQSQEAIRDQVGKVNIRIDNIDKIITHIDYAVQRFQEVDANYAATIKGKIDEYTQQNNRMGSNGSFGGMAVIGGSKNFNAVDLLAMDDINALDRSYKPSTTGNNNSYIRQGTGINGGKASSFWDENGELITNVAICALEVTAVVLAAPVIAAGLAVGATAGAIFFGVAAAIGAIFSANTFVDSGAKVIQKSQGKTGDEYTGFNAIQSGIQLGTHDKKKAEDIYNVAALGAGVFSLGAGGVAGGLSKVKNIEAINAARTLEKTEPIVMNANKVAKVTTKFDKLSIKNNARVIDFANKVPGVSSKETRAFRQAKKSYDASIKYNGIQKEITGFNTEITKAIKSTVVGVTAAGIEEVEPKGIEALNSY